MRQEERETTVSYSDADETATVMSYSAAMVNRLKKLAEEKPDEAKIVWTDEKDGGIEVRVPKKWIKVSPTVKVKMTEEKRTALRERMNRINAEARRKSEEIREK